MKILYVEDQLSQNINRVLSLFGESIGLSGRIKRKLQEWENDEYGASNEEIRDLLNESGVLTVAINFPDALAKIENTWDQYDMYIIDRQLAENTGDYLIDEIKEIIPDFSETQFEKYLSREGDFLLLRLYGKGDQTKTGMFYFLTGYNDELRALDDLSSLYDAGCFSKTQILEKGNDNHLQHLSKIISDAPSIILRKNNPEIFEALSFLSKDRKDQLKLEKLLDASEGCSKEKRSEILLNARTFIEDRLIKQIYKFKCNIPPISNSFNTNINDLNNRPSINNKLKTIISNEARSMGLTAYSLCSKYMHTGEFPSKDEFLAAIYCIRGFILDVGKDE